MSPARARPDDIKLQASSSRFHPANIQFLNPGRVPCPRAPLAIAALPGFLSLPSTVQQRRPRGQSYIGASHRPVRACAHVLYMAQCTLLYAGGTERERTVCMSDSPTQLEGCTVLVHEGGTQHERCMRVPGAALSRLESDTSDC